jgi:type I site-specific restriction endonuclease
MNNHSGENVGVCRVVAISGLEQSFAEAQPRALIQLASDAGHAGARNVLFLVDRADLERPTAASSPSSTTSSTSSRTSLMAFGVDR